jgi:pimeloyl-ACP methyl ester carboxylesterase
MHTLYFIPGLGADERLFSKLKLGEYERKYIRWLPPLANETLPAYAKRLSGQIDSKNGFSLIGVSFGGMIAVELSKILHPQHLILIASTKTYKEIPWTLRILKYLPVYKFLTESFVRWLAKLNKRRFGIFNETEMHLFATMLLSCPAGYLSGAIHMIVNWKNTSFPASIVHIHGDNDRLFPVHRIKNPLLVKGGTHFMPYHNASEIEKIIRQETGK